jgi:uncharacterized protein YbjT (DUF2867 family)
MSTSRHVFVTGGTGYMGSRVIPALLRRGHRISALVRQESSSKLPEECGRVVGNALDWNTFADLVPPADTFLHLVGVAHPSPARAAEFQSVDLASARASAKAAATAGISHFVYVSVAQPAPVMKAYVEARAEAEVAIRATGISATLLRPWYVLGPGHRWPFLLLPVYRFLQLLPPTRDTAVRLHPVMLEQMVAALVRAVENPASGVRIVEASEIRKASLEA